MLYSIFYIITSLLASLSLFGRDQPVKVFGPVGIQAYIDSNMKLSSTYLTYPLEVSELEEGLVKALGSIGGIAVTAYPLRHKVDPMYPVLYTSIHLLLYIWIYMDIYMDMDISLFYSVLFSLKVTSFGYLFEEPEKRGKLDAQRAKQLGATGKDLGILLLLLSIYLYLILLISSILIYLIYHLSSIYLLGILTSGKDVTLADGTVIKSTDVIGETRLIYLPV